MRSDTAELARISQSLETATPQQILRWAIETYRDKLTMATAFGPDGCCLIAMIAEIRDETGLLPDIFNLDTGYQFQETLDLREEIQRKYNIPIRLVTAEETVGEMEKRFGGPIYGTNPDHCCHLRKVVPLNKAVEGFEAWITAIRRNQTPERAVQPIVGIDPRLDLIKINPLANWTKEQVWDYIETHDVPTNPLHQQGFPSVGCYPCTQAVAPGAGERAGRWAGTAKRECGLHLGADGKLKRAATSSV